MFFVVLFFCLKKIGTAHIFTSFSCFLCVFAYAPVVHSHLFYAVENIFLAFKSPYKLPELRFYPNSQEISTITHCNKRDIRLIVIIVFHRR